MCCAVTAECNQLFQQLEFCSRIKRSVHCHQLHKCSVYSSRLYKLLSTQAQTLLNFDCLTVKRLEHKTANCTIGIIAPGKIQGYSK